MLPVVLLMAFAAAACSGGSSGSGDAQGAELFANNCAVCHGAAGDGAPTGPPLVHELYVPEQTSDEAFRIAVQEGASEEHWEYGDMPRTPGLSDDEVAAITEHVRDLQREAGLVE